MAGATGGSREKVTAWSRGKGLAGVGVRERGADHDPRVLVQVFSLRLYIVSIPPWGKFLLLSEPQFPHL